MALSPVLCAAAAFIRRLRNQSNEPWSDAAATGAMPGNVRGTLSSGGAEGGSVTIEGPFLHPNLFTINRINISNGITLLAFIFKKCFFIPFFARVLNLNQSTFCPIVP